jgi:hypothetical protein
MEIHDGVVHPMICPRSPKEVMAGWVYLPRFIDKIRLHQAGLLHADYQQNFARRGFDAQWLRAAGLDADAFIAMVKSTVTDGEVADWVLRHVKRTEAEKAAFNQFILNHGREEDSELRARLRTRKEQSGLGNRDDITTFVDFIDADEKRS